MCDSRSFRITNMRLSVHNPKEESRYYERRAENRDLRDKETAETPRRAIGVIVSFPDPSLERLKHRGDKVLSQIDSSVFHGYLLDSA